MRKGFEQFSSSIAWRVIGLQSSAKKTIRAGLKGLTVLLPGNPIILATIKLIPCTKYKI